MQSIVNYRIPINKDGKLGNPEIVKKWTSEMGAPRYKKPKNKSKPKPKDLYTEEIQEVEI